MPHNCVCSYNISNSTRNLNCPSDRGMCQVLTLGIDYSLQQHIYFSFESYQTSEHSELWAENPLGNV